MFMINIPEKIARSSEFFEKVMANGGMTHEEHLEWIVIGGGYTGLQKTLLSFNRMMEHGTPMVLPTKEVDEARIERAMKAFLGDSHRLPLEPIVAKKQLTAFSTETADLSTHFSAVRMPI